MSNWSLFVCLILAGTASAQRRPPRFNELTPEQWVAQLRGGDANERQMAASTLRRLVNHKRIVVPALVQALKDEDAGVRIAAASSLWALERDQRTIEVLQDGLKSDTRQPRPMALAALRQIGPGAHRAVSTLLKLLSDSEASVVQDAARTLAHCIPGVPPDDPILEDAAVPALVRLLNDESLETKLVAISALGAIGSRAREAAGELEGYLKSSDAALRIAVADALWLINRGPETQSVLVEALELEDGLLQCAALDALAWRGRAARENVPAVRKLLNASSQRTRSTALVALRCVGEWDDKTIHTLAEMVRDDSAPVLRAAAAQLLGQVGEKARSAEEFLREAMRGDRLKLVRAASGEGLWLIAHDPEGLRVLIQQVGDRHSSWTLDALPPPPLTLVGQLRKEALPALKSLESHEFGEARLAFLKTLILAGRDDVDLLTGYLSHSEEAVRLLSTQALSKLGPRARAASGALAKRLADTSTEVRAAAVQALNEVAFTAVDTAEAFRRLLANPHHSSRVADVLGLIGTKGTAALAELTVLLDEPDANGRSAVAWGLADIGGAEAAPALIRVLGDKDLEIRRAAVSGLRTSGSAGKAVIEALRAALEEKDFLLRTWAAEALWNIARHPGSVTALVALIDDKTGGGDRRVAIRSLSAISAPLEVQLPPLTRALEDELTCEEAALQLKAIGPKAQGALPALLRVVQTMPAGRGVRAAVDTVLHISPDNKELVALLIERGVENWADELGRLGPNAVAAIPALQRYIRGRSGEGIGFATAAPVLERIAPEVFTTADRHTQPEAVAPSAGDSASFWLFLVLALAALAAVFRRAVMKRRLKGEAHAVSDPT